MITITTVDNNKSKSVLFSLLFHLWTKSEFDMGRNTLIQMVQFENNFSRKLKQCKCCEIKNAGNSVLFLMCLMNCGAFQKLLYIEGNFWSNARKNFSSYTCNGSMNSDMIEIKLLKNMNALIFHFFSTFYWNRIIPLKFFFAVGFVWFRYYRIFQYNYCSATLMVVFSVICKSAKLHYIFTMYKKVE